MAEPFCEKRSRKKGSAVLLDQNPQDLIHAMRVVTNSPFELVRTLMGLLVGHPTAHEPPLPQLMHKNEFSVGRREARFNPDLALRHIIINGIMPSEREVNGKPITDSPTVHDPYLQCRRAEHIQQETMGRNRKALLLMGRQAMRKAGTSHINHLYPFGNIPCTPSKPCNSNASPAVMLDIRTS